MPVLLILFFTLFNSNAFAQSEVYSRVVQKHIKKVRDRWTLEDLYLRRKYRAPKGRWSPWRSPMFELLVDFRFGPGGLDKTGVTGKDSELSSLGTQLQFHYGALGLGLDRSQTKVSEKNVFYKYDDFALSYRVVGPSTQSTHFTFLVGTRGGRHNDYGALNQQFYGVLTNFYLFRHLGLEGQYKVLSQTETSTHSVNGVNYHWGIFWEFSILRLYLNFNQDYHTATSKVDQVSLNQRISSTLLGARLAF
jgi:hypothetical protein